MHCNSNREPNVAKRHSIMNKPINKHGGKRLNAGRKIKDPSGPVVRVVTWITAKQARHFAENPHLNRTDEIKKALDAWISGV